MRALTLPWLRFIAGLLITVLCLWLVLRQVRVDEVKKAIEHIGWRWLAFAPLALTAGYAIRIYRWWWMLHRCDPAVRLGSCAWLLLAGFAVNNVIPFRAGDALRIVGLRGKLHAPVMRALGSLLIERILDLTILLAFFLLGMLNLGETELPAGYLYTLLLIASAGGLAWVVLLWMGEDLERFLLKICRARVFDKYRPSAERYTRNLFTMLSIVRMPGSALKLLAMTALVWGCEGGVFAAVAAGLHYNGRDFGPWFSLAAGSLATMIPSSPGYVGPFDFFTTAGFTAYGTGRAAAVAMALIVHIVLWVPVTVTGLACLLFSQLRGRPMQRMSGVIHQEEQL